MHLQGLYAITDNVLTPSTRLLECVEHALQGGTQVLQYRDKTSDREKRALEAFALKTLCARYQCTFIINDDVELCKEIGADGVHLGIDDTNIADARQRLGNDVIIGATCHGSLALAQKAVADGADYVAFGRFYRSNTKPDAIPADLDEIQKGLKQLNVPAVAIGGIRLHHAEALLKAGFSMLAVIEDIFKTGNMASDITHQCQAYCDVFTHYQ